jgi:hypothetical protein
VCSDAENEIAHLKRLLNVIRRAKFKGKLAVFLGWPSSDKDDGCAMGKMSLLQFTANLESFDVGQIHVQRDDIKLVAGRQP